MRIGLFLTNQQPLGRLMRKALREQEEYVAYVCAAGWDGVFTGQHYLSDFSQLQPFLFLASLAPLAGQMDLGIAVALLPLANPVEFAEQVATLDVIADGRTIIGVGRGYRAAEFAAFGLNPQEAGRRFRENYAVVRALLAGERVTCDLPWCQLDGAALTTLPLQAGGPPFWIGATGEKALRRAASLAEGWVSNPATDAGEVARQAGLLREATPAGEKWPTVAAFREIFCADSEATAERIAGPYLTAKYGAYGRWGQGELVGDPQRLRNDVLSFDASRFVLGSPDQCLAALRWWRDEVRVDYLLLRTEWAGLPKEQAMWSMKLLSEEVLPALRADNWAEEGRSR